MELRLLPLQLSPQKYLLGKFPPPFTKKPKESLQNTPRNIKETGHPFSWLEPPLDWNSFQQNVI